MAHLLRATSETQRTWALRQTHVAALLLLCSGLLAALVFAKPANRTDERSHAGVATIGKSLRLGSGSGLPSPLLATLVAVGQIERLSIGDAFGRSSLGRSRCCPPAGAAAVAAACRRAGSAPPPHAPAGDAPAADSSSASAPGAEPEQPLAELELAANGWPSETGSIITNATLPALLRRFGANREKAIIFNTFMLGAS